MVVLHTLRSLRYIAMGLLRRGEPFTADGIVTTRIYSGFRKLDMFMHVNNASYLELFEFARWEQAGRLRMFARYRQGHCYPIVAAAFVEYMAPLKAFCFVRVSSRMLGTSGKWLLMEQTMRSDDERQLHASAVYKI